MLNVNPTGVYTKKAEDYATFRPAYAPEAIDALLSLTGLDSSWGVADIGSGTGNVSKYLVRHARRVYAVEPNEAMRRQAELLLNSYASFASISGTAEDTTLADHSVDLITVGQALHWFEPQATKAEFARILKPGGLLASISNRFGDDDGPDVSDYYRTKGLRRLGFPVAVTESWQQFIGGARSAAGSPSPGDAGYDRFVQEQREVFDARATDGMITVEYSTELLVGHLDADVAA
jgi:SAM-dependent methyltransferase